MNLRRETLLPAAILWAGAAGASRAGPPACEKAPLYSVRLALSNEERRLAGPGRAAAFSFLDRDFHGWSAGADASSVHRYGRDDGDAGISGARAFAGRKAYAGFALGGAARRILLPSLRGALIGGAPLAFGAWWEGEMSYRLYENVDVYAVAPVLFREIRGVRFSVGYTLAAAGYASGERSGWLASYRAKAEWPRCRGVRPWVLFARTREPFEAGAFAAVRDFRADHYGAGAAYLIAPGFDLELSGGYEDRPALGERVWTMGAAIVHSWGGAR